MLFRSDNNNQPNCELQRYLEGKPVSKFAKKMDALSKAIDGYVDQLKATFEGKIDFEGQRKADQLNNLILSLTTVIALVAGYALQSMLLTFGIYGAGFLTALLVVVPPWPCYNKNPVNWLPSSKKQGKVKTK